MTASCVLVGCSGSVRFERDEVLHAIEGVTDEQSVAIDTVLVELFGTPDSPSLPSTGGMDEWLDLAALEQCSGEVISHEPGVTRGLYGRHCARCHGVTGDGRGPFALYQDPYPRDFRRGVFKWKSTYRDSPPTQGDLQRVLEHGVAGAAMPSFRLLEQEERDALVEYVSYLSIRGQLERELVLLTVEELDDNRSVSIEDAARLLPPIVNAWREASMRVVEPTTPMPRIDDELIASGRELYHGERAGCAKCHGDEGRGLQSPVSLADVDYDIWDTQRRVAKADAVGSERLAVAALRAFPPRPTWGKRLSEPARGGDEPIDWFRRLHQGVAGTPMPALGPIAPGGDASLTEEEIWSLVAYVRQLVGHAADESLDRLAMGAAE